MRTAGCYKRERIDLAPTEHIGLLGGGAAVPAYRRAGRPLADGGRRVTATVRIPAGRLVADPPSVWDPRAAGTPGAAGLPAGPAPSRALLWSGPAKPLLSLVRGTEDGDDGGTEPPTG